MKPRVTDSCPRNPTAARRLLAPVAGVALSLLAGVAQAGTYDFNNGTMSGLTAYNPLVPFGCGASYTLAGGALQITAPSSVNPGALGPARAGAYPAGLSYSNFGVSVDLLGWDDTLQQAVGVMGRAQEIGLGTTDGYSVTYVRLFGLPASQLVLSRISNEQVTAIASQWISLDPSKDYRIEMLGSGSQLVGNLYELSNLSQPVATCSAVDATYASGACGLVVNATVQNLSTKLDATLDNLSIIPEPSTAALVMFGGVVLALRRRIAPQA